MVSYPSRSERRQTLFYSIAEKGSLSVDQVVLYKSEIIKLEKDGFFIFNLVDFDWSKKLYSATVSWEKAYPQGVPYMVYSYIHRAIDTFPKPYVETFAQELYIVSQRANLK